MSRTNYYEQKKQYITLLNLAMKPLTDFGGIEYAHAYGTEQEYLKIHDSVGGSIFLDVTAHDTEEILLEVIAACVGQVPKSIIVSKNERRKIAPMFKKVG